MDVTTVLAIGACAAVFCAWLVLPHRAPAVAGAVAKSEIREPATVTAA